jgi:hypothetical protein
MNRCVSRDTPMDKSYKNSRRNNVKIGLLQFSKTFVTADIPPTAKISKSSLIDDSIFLQHYAELANNSG